MKRFLKMLWNDILWFFQNDDNDDFNGGGGNREKKLQPIRVRRD